MRDAVDAGINAERLRRRDLAIPVHGVRDRAGRRGFSEFVAAVALVMAPDQFFSHTTAARLWGAPLPRIVQDGGEVHVSTIGDGVRMRRPGVVSHRIAASMPVELDGRSIANPADTWFQCAGLLGVGALVAVGDHIVGRNQLATIDDLRAAVAPGARHVVRARTALELVRTGSESAMETWWRLAVVEAGFDEPELNLDVHDGSGRFLGRVDMAWPEHRIALEYDGDHHRERDVFQHDQQRDNGFVVNDWIVVHATAADRARPAVLFQRLRQAFAHRLVTGRRFVI